MKMTQGQFNRLLKKNNQTRKIHKPLKQNVSHNISEKHRNKKKHINLKAITLKSYK
jgi:hypothetical protein